MSSDLIEGQVKVQDGHVYKCISVLQDDASELVLVDITQPDNSFPVAGYAVNTDGNVQFVSVDGAVYGVDTLKIVNTGVPEPDYS